MDPPFSIVYLITFTCYGTHLHGDERGSVDRIHNLVGSPTIEPTHAKIQRAARTMEQAPYFLDEVRRGVVLESVCRTCAVRQWRVLALHVRSNHVHCVVRAEEKPERIMTAMKAHASRALDREGLDEPGRKRWTRHGSTRYLWDDGQIHRAIAYVVEEQGQPMAVFQETNSAIRSLAVAAR